MAAWEEEVVAVHSQQYCESIAIEAVAAEE